MQGRGLAETERCDMASQSWHSLASKHTVCQLLARCRFGGHGALQLRHFCQRLVKEHMQVLQCWQRDSRMVAQGCL